MSKYSLIKFDFKNCDATSIIRTLIRNKSLLVENKSYDFLKFRKGPKRIYIIEENINNSCIKSLCKMQFNPVIKLSEATSSQLQAAVSSYWPSSTQCK